MKPILLSAFLAGAVLVATSASRAMEPRTEESVPAFIKVVKEPRPYFPSRLLRNGLTQGEAVIAVSVDPSGKLQDCLVSRYTHKEFADSALAAVRQWQFKPLRPVGVIMEITVLFQTTGIVAVERYGGDADPYPHDRYTGYVFEPCPRDKLDRPPKATRVVSPRSPVDQNGQGITGTVQVSFYIDEQGRTRLVSSTSTENSVLASLATAAVEQWQFEPPTHDGKPVLVKATQRFAFGPRGEE